MITLYIAIKEAKLLQVEVEDVEKTHQLHIVICYVIVELLRETELSTCRRQILVFIVKREGRRKGEKTMKTRVKHAHAPAI